MTTNGGKGRLSTVSYTIVRRTGSMNPSRLIAGLMMEAVAIVFLFLDFPTAVVAVFAILGIGMMGLPRKPSAD